MKAVTTLTKDTKIYDEFIDFIAKGVSSESLTQFQFSESTKEQIEDLVYRAKNGELTQEEKKELDELLFIEHLITITQAKAHKYMKAQDKEA